MILNYADEWMSSTRPRRITCEREHIVAELARGRQEAYLEGFRLYLLGETHPR